MEPFPLGISFYQEDKDTFRSKAGLSMLGSKRDAFFELLIKEGIDCNAHTRPREVPPEDRGRWDHYHAQAAFIGDDGCIVADISVINKLREKYVMNIKELSPEPKFPLGNLLGSIKKRLLPSRSPT